MRFLRFGRGTPSPRLYNGDQGPFDLGNVIEIHLRSEHGGRTVLRTAWAVALAGLWHGARLSGLIIGGVCSTIYGGGPQPDRAWLWGGIALSTSHCSMDIILLGHADFVARAAKLRVQRGGKIFNCFLVAFYMIVEGLRCWTDGSQPRSYSGVTNETSLSGFPLDPGTRYRSPAQGRFSCRGAAGQRDRCADKASRLAWAGRSVIALAPCQFPSTTLYKKQY